MAGAKRYADFKNQYKGGIIMPKALTVNVNTEQGEQLQQLRLKYQSNVGEHAYYILLLQAGYRVSEIAKRMSRNKHTIRYWVKQYNAKGVEGLFSRLPPGRPDKKTREVAEQLNRLLDESPNAYGYQQKGWQINLLIDYFKRQGKGNCAGTIYRALKQQHRVYKRFAKRVPLSCPSPEEKLAQIEQLIQAIDEAKQQNTIEILFEDESHFNNEPYVERGWFKRGEKKQWRCR